MRAFPPIDEGWTHFFRPPAQTLRGDVDDHQLRRRPPRQFDAVAASRALLATLAATLVACASDARDDFERRVLPVLEQRCFSTACHGVGPDQAWPDDDGLFVRVRSDGRVADVDEAHAAALSRVSVEAPRASTLLRVPMPGWAGGGPHAGAAAFAGPDDPGAIAILAWIEREEAGGEDIALTALEAQFAEDVAPVLVERCARQGCHGSRDVAFSAFGLRPDPVDGRISPAEIPAARRSVRKHLDLWGADPTRSRLVRKAIGRAAGGLFHRGNAGTFFPDAPPGSPLEAPGMQAILRWARAERAAVGVEEGVTPRALIWVEGPPASRAPFRIEAGPVGSDLWIGTWPGLEDARNLTAGLHPGREVEIRDPAISHDATRVAFAMRADGAATFELWELELATGAARALPGTEEGYRPFWSPDDRRIGFFTWSHLSTTPAEGGAVRRLAEARDARGGSWSPNGTIVYSPHQAGSLLAISEQGGEPRAATELEGTDGDGTHRFPSFLPDGERFVYLERLSSLGRERRAGVLLGRLGSTAPLARLLDEATNAVVVGDRLLFARDGALMTQRLDPDRNAVVGEPKALVGDLLMNLRFSYGVFSASEEGLLCFLAGRQSDRSQLVWRDRTGQRLGELGAPGILSGYGGLALSPDGRWVAVSRIEEGIADADVWLYDLSRGTETRLARPDVDDHDPLFTPDSGALVFGSRGGAGGLGLARIVRRDLRTGDERELLREETRGLAPRAFTSDAEGLVYERADAANLGVSDVRLHPLAGEGEDRELVASEADDSLAQLSPDGRWLAWDSNDSGQYEVYVAPFPALGAPVQVSRAGGVQPRWNPRGGELFFKTPDNMLTAVPVHASAGTFAVGTPEPLFQVVEFVGWTYDVAPDGERFLVREPLAERGVSPITILTDWTSLAGAR